jgi:uncharacterized RDD family membrane protein YckC
MATAPQSFPTPSPAAVKAGFWIRVVAYLIDGIILLIVESIINLALRGNSSAQFGINLLIGAVYFVYFWSGSSPFPGQTIGMKVLNLRVVRADGSSLDFVQGLIRYVGIIISSIPLGLGLAWVGWDPNKQGWHDKMAGTYVVKA